MIIGRGDITISVRDPVVNADNIFNVIRNYDDRFTHTAGTTTLTVDGFDIVIRYNGSGGAADMYLDDRWWFPASVSGDFTYFLIITETVFYFLIKTQNAANTPVTGFCWIKENGINYFGVAVRNQSTGQIDSMSFTNKTNGGTYYAIKKHAQFALNSQSILFISASVMADNAGNYQVLSGLRSCSTVTFNTEVSINYINYYAIGTNTLIRDSGGS